MSKLYYILHPEKHKKGRGLLYYANGGTLVPDFRNNDYNQLGITDSLGENREGTCKCSTEHIYYIKKDKEGMYVAGTAKASKKGVTLNRESFLKRHHNLQLEEKLKSIEKRDPNFWETLEGIAEHYRTFAKSNQGRLSDIISAISQADISKPTIHSIRYRVKDEDSLLVKLIEKCSEVPQTPQGNAEVEKYRCVTKQNYYKIITDLIGVRILIRYRYQWETVHRLIWELFHSDDQGYVQDWEKEYINDPGLNFIAEQPKAYIKQDSDRGIYEAIGENTFMIKTSDNHYASLHYVVNFGGCYVEIQVRTIFDEAWCECNHDFIYKAVVTSKKDKRILDRLSTILAEHTTASEEIVSLMCDIADPGKEFRGKRTNKKLCESNEFKPNVEREFKTYEAITQRALRLSQKEDLTLEGI